MGKLGILACCVLLSACSGDSDDGPGPGPDIVAESTIVLTRANGVSGRQTVNVAIPMPAGLVTDERNVRITRGGAEIPAARRGLARYSDGSWRSIQVQFAADDSVTAVDFAAGVAGAAGGTMQPVSELVGDDGLPRVWATLSAAWLAQSGVVGPIVPRASIAGTPLDAWGGICDYTRWDTNAFISGSGSRDVWLFDRVTAMQRGYAFAGDMSAQRSAYREAELYRAGLTINSNGVATGLAVPDANDDLKYHYSQGMAIHYLLTGDDRFREGAEAVARRTFEHWRDPGYSGGDDFWTERHAGFALLASEWAAIVSDDAAATFAAASDTQVDAYLDMQERYPVGYTDREARCFAHSADAHGEGYGYNGCSPWMSGILADALDGYLRRVGGTRADRVRASLVKLGRIIARDGRDSSGRPVYWMGVGVDRDEADEYDEHWGESAYVVALAWHHGGRNDSSLRSVADALVAGTREQGEAGQLRSFNWQCRSAVMTPALLAQ